MASPSTTTIVAGSQATVPVPPAVEGAPPTRQLGRRPALPGGRAIVGGFLVALAAFGTFAAYTSATTGPGTDFAVARRDLALGSRITASDVVLVPMKLPTTLSRGGAFSELFGLLGRTVVGPVRRGELVQAGDVVDKPSGPDDLEVSFAIEHARALGGGLGPGETVDVVATFGSGGDSYTTVVVRAARVLATDHGRGTLSDGRTQTISVAVGRPDEALALVHAVNAGEVTLVRTSGTSPDRPGASTYRAPRAEPARS